MGNLTNDRPIVIVEDDDQMAAIVRQVLEKAKIGPVVAFGDGLAAFRWLARTGNAMALVDWQLPGMSGLGLVEMIRSHPGSRNPFLPVSMLTARNQRADVVRALNAGANGFLVKPISPRRLIEHVAGVLARPSAFILTRDYFGPDRRRASPGISVPGERRIRPPDSDLGRDAHAWVIHAHKVGSLNTPVLAGFGTESELAQVKAEVRRRRLGLLAPEASELLAPGGFPEHRLPELVTGAQQVARRIGMLHPPALELSVAIGDAARRGDDARTRQLAGVLYDLFQPGLIADDEASRRITREALGSAAAETAP